MGAGSRPIRWQSRGKAVGLCRFNNEINIVFMVEPALPHQ